MYDDFAWTRLTTPPLTVIAQPVYNMGVAAAKALIRQMEGRPPGPPAQFTATLVRRGSVGPCRATGDAEPEELAATVT
jgi:LacI family transcriptional regulator